MRKATLNPNLRGALAGGSALLMAAVTAILLLACMNVANLLLARGLEGQAS